ncbi:hypothetical protein M9Y10_001666 [Tritrichomonas musculus]|uniref:Calcineurin-like phosphoesterase domain-containing protein n=1 Tax=Tritrichomonas musculus TaxID=1915356 RepID=A0ABR2L812_9EUKA
MNFIKKLFSNWFKSKEEIPSVELPPTKPFLFKDTIKSPKHADNIRRLKKLNLYQYEMDENSLKNDQKINLSNDKKLESNGKIRSLENQSEIQPKAKVDIILEALSEEIISNKPSLSMFSPPKSIDASNVHTETFQLDFKPGAKVSDTLEPSNHEVAESKQSEFSFKFPKFQEQGAKSKSALETISKLDASKSEQNHREIGSIPESSFKLTSFNVTIPNKSSWNPPNPASSKPIKKSNEPPTTFRLPISLDYSSKESSSRENNLDHLSLPKSSWNPSLQVKESNWEGPPSGSSWNPPSGSSWNPPSGSSWNPPSGSSWNPPSGSSWNPPSGSSWNPPSGSSWNPPSGSSWNPPSGSSWNPPNESSWNPPSGSSWNPPSGSSWNPPSGSSWNPPNESSWNPPNESSWNPPSGSSWNPPSGSSWNPPSGSSWNPPNESSWNPPSGSSWNPPNESSWNPPSGSSWNPPSGSSWNPPSGSSWEKPPLPDKKEHHRSRDVPIYVMTDLHMNPEPLYGAVSLTDGIVMINGDIITGVTFDRNTNKLGSKKNHRIQKTVKGTWTDPLAAIKILEKRKSKYPLIVGFGNHELVSSNQKTPYSYHGSSIANIYDWIKALKRIDAIPVCTWPDLSHKGAYNYYKYSTSYFFSYVTSKYHQNRAEYEQNGVMKISSDIKSICDSSTKEIHLLLHASFQEGTKVMRAIIHSLANMNLNFNIFSVHFVYYLGHKHGSAIEPAYQIHGNYWEGKVEEIISGKHKTIRCIFPNCADDCVKIDTKGQKSMKARFISKR